MLSLLPFFYQILELFRQCRTFLFFKILELFRQCSTFLFFQILELFRQCRTFLFFQILELFRQCKTFLFFQILELFRQCSTFLFFILFPGIQFKLIFQFSQLVFENNLRSQSRLRLQISSIKIRPEMVIQYRLLLFTIRYFL